MGRHPTVTTRVYALLGLGVALMALVGCQDSAPTKVYTKEDFNKTAPPAGYIQNVPKAPEGPPAGAGPGAAKTNG